MNRISPKTIYLRLDELHVDAELNLRISYGDVDALAVRLMTRGLLEPLLVRRDGRQYVLVNGHRRRRAFLRSKELRIESVHGRHELFEGDHKLGLAPGPQHPDFSIERIACHLVSEEGLETDSLFTELTYNDGKPHTLLEKMLHVSRMLKRQVSIPDAMATTGFSRSQIQVARSLHPADKRVLEMVETGKISQQMALKLIKKLPPQDQLALVETAFAFARRHGREKLLSKDFRWPDQKKKFKRVVQGELFVISSSPTEDRLNRLLGRFSNTSAYPDKSTRERLEVIHHVAQYLKGGLSLPRLQREIIGG
jgi:ParB-like nuclease domain